MLISGSALDRNVEGGYTALALEELDLRGRGRLGQIIALPLVMAAIGKSKVRRNLE